MNPLLIAQLLAQFGPAAFGLLKSLAEIWTKPSLTPEEVKAFCDMSKKSYDSYIDEAKQNKIG